MKYQVNIYFTMYKTYEVEADNEEQAKDHAFDIYECESIEDTLSGAEYVDNSGEAEIADLG